MRRLAASRRFSTTTTPTTAASAAFAPDVPAPSQPPLYHPRRVLRVFTLPDITPFLHSYLHMRRITHHRLQHDKHTPPHTRTTDERDADWLLVSQPTPVYTMGRAAKLKHVRLPTTTQPLDCTSLEQATTLTTTLHPATTTQPHLLRLDRGGETTWHGPGQLLLYPLINLHHTRCDLHHYLRSLERAVSTALHSLPLSSAIPIRSDPQYTGVWREGRKVAAIGVGCSRWHTTHGIALNVDVDKRVYEPITPCGIDEVGRTVGNVRDEWEREGRHWMDDGYERVREAVVRELGEVLGMECRVETESVESVLQRWDEAELRRAGTSAAAAAAAAAMPQSQSTASSVSPTVPSVPSVSASMLM